MRCGWCGTDNERGTNCVSCGGPLPPPREEGAGPAPPPPPREVPGVFVRRVLYWDPAVVFGWIVTGFGVLISLPFIGVGFVFPPMLFGLLVTGFWPLFGCWILLRSRRKGLARLDVLRRGRIVAGSVTGADERSVTYVFDVEGRRYAGVVHVAEGAPAPDRDCPVHVLYLPEDPDRNEIWPLLG